MPTTLTIFCRRPRRDIGKQRIAADIGADRTLLLAEHLLAAVIEDADSWTGPVVLAPADPDDSDWAGDLLTRPARVVAQPSGNLGTRINAVDRCVRRAGDTHVIYIGSDAPVLDLDYLRQAAGALAACDVVLGPAMDGGVTLMGSRVPWPPLEGLPWSSDLLCKSLELLCVENGLTVYSQDPRYDIDHAHDLPTLFRDLENDERPARQSLRAWLAESGLG